MKYINTYEKLLSNNIYLVIKLLLSDIDLHYVIRTTKKELEKAEENMDKLNAMLIYDYFCLYVDDNINKDFLEDYGVPNSVLKCKDFNIIYKTENKQDAINKLKIVITINKYNL